MNIIRRTYNHTGVVVTVPARQVRVAIVAPDDPVILAGSWHCDMSWTDAFPYDPATQTTAPQKAVWMSWHRPLANSGASFTRNNLACYGGALPRSAILTPYRYDAAGDAFDLDAWNPSFWLAFRAMAEWCNEIGQRLVVCIGNECEMRKADRKAQSPWWHNAQGVDGMYADDAIPYWRALTRKVLEVLDGLDFGIEPINECNNRNGLDATRAILDELHAAGFPVERISLGAMMLDCNFLGYDKPWPDQYDEADGNFTNQVYIGKAVDSLWGAHQRNRAWYPIHGVLEPQEHPDQPFGRRWHQATDWWVRHIGNSVRLYLSSDGSEHGSGYNGRPAGERWAAAISAILAEGRRNIRIGTDAKFLFEAFQQGVPPAIFAAVLDRMAEAIMAAGYTLSNRGKFPEPVVVIPPTEPQPEPPPVVPPVTPPAPVVKHSAWYWLIPRFSRKWPWILINFRRWWLTLTGKE